MVFLQFSFTFSLPPFHFTLIPYFHPLPNSSLVFYVVDLFVKLYKECHMILYNVIAIVSFGYIYFLIKTIFCLLGQQRVCQVNSSWSLTTIYSQNMCYSESLKPAGTYGEHFGWLEKILDQHFRYFVDP